MYLEIDPYNIQYAEIKEIAKMLNDGGVAIIPTDSVYAFVCALNQKQAMLKICNLAGKKPERSNLSILLNSLEDIGIYTTPFGTKIFRLMKACLPGPFTFILNASNTIPKIFLSKRKTIGIRIPDNLICEQLIAVLGQPLISASLKSEDEILEYLTDPQEIAAEWEQKVDLIIASGNSELLASTIIDCTGLDPILIREGAGILP